MSSSKGMPKRYIHVLSLTPLVLITLGPIAHAYNCGTREKRCDLPVRRQTRGVVRREAHEDQEIRQRLRGKALEEIAVERRDERELDFSRP